MSPQLHGRASHVATVRWAVVSALLIAGASLAADADSPTWRTRLSAGYDAYVHTYYLAVDDTTETVSEVNATAEIEGRSARGAVHRWRLRSEVSAGSELLRGLFDGDWQWRPGGGAPRLRADLTWFGRRYTEDSDYALSSDNHEARGELRWWPWRGDDLALDLRASGKLLDFRTPSTLEQDYRETGAGAFLSSAGSLDRAWRVGLRAIGRAYPDSSAIDRDVVAAEGDLDAGGDRYDLWLYHRSERRRVADVTARPSAWSHWTDLRLAVPAGPGHVVTNLNNEVWRYDQETSAYFDSWRTDVEFGYRWGDLLDVLWHALATVDHLDAGDSPESYTQVGLRGSVESYAHPFTGILALEYGHRWYRNPATGDLDFLTGDLADLSLGYTDFSYLEIWAMATWNLHDRLALDLIASYQPEKHTEQDDDTALGYGTVRLVWRP